MDYLGQPRVFHHVCRQDDANDGAPHKAVLLIGKPLHTTLCVRRMQHNTKDNQSGVDQRSSFVRMAHQAGLQSHTLTQPNHMSSTI